MNWKSAATLVAALAASAFGQEVPGAEGPATGPVLGDGPREIATAASAAKRMSAPARRVAMPALDASPLLDQDAAWAAMPALRAAPRVGVIRTFRQIRAPARLVSGGRGVETLADGSLVWSAEVGSPGALGLRLHVSRCELPEGATLVAYDAEEPAEAYGPFAGRGQRAAGGFYLPTVFGETARVEIRVPAKSAGARMRFAIDRAAQRYRERGEGMADPRVGAAAKPANCNNNVACDADYTQDVARAVASMEISTPGGVFLCTGALLNDSNSSTSVPYFLTAHHCVSTESEANATEFYFDYRAATCDGAPPPLSGVPRVAGATLLATSQSNDFTLLRLTGTLPANRFFCGWSATRQATSRTAVGVHHPGGTHMRYSYGTLLDPDGSFHQVQWSSGVTAGGSSGSPLFNPEKQVIGQLYGGSSSCSFPSGIDEYGRFDRTYASVSQYLGAGAVTTGDSNDPGDDAPAGATLLETTLLGASHGPHTLAADDAVDWFAFDLRPGERCRFFSTGADDVRAALLSDGPAQTVAAADDDSGGSLQFSIDFTSVAGGRHLLRVTAAAPGAGAEYTLHHVRLDTRETAPPRKVQQLRRSVASGTVTLRWRDRARNGDGYYVEISGDEGVAWTRVAELPRDARRFEHDPGPGPHLYRVGAWNAAPAVRYRQLSAFVVDADQLDASDPLDDSGAGATVLVPPSGGTTPVRSFSRSDGEDWFRITLTAGTTCTFETTGAYDTYAELFDDADGFSQQISDDDSGRGRNFRLAFRAPRTAAYWLRVSPYRESDLVAYALAWQVK